MQDALTEAATLIQEIPDFLKLFVKEAGGIRTRIIEKCVSQEALDTKTVNIVLSIVESMFLKPFAVKVDEVGAGIEKILNPTYVDDLMMKKITKKLSDQRISYEEQKDAMKLLFEIKAQTYEKQIKDLKEELESLRANPGPPRRRQSSQSADAKETAGATSDSKNINDPSDLPNAGTKLKKQVSFSEKVLEATQVIPVSATFSTEVENTSPRTKAAKTVKSVKSEKKQEYQVHQRVETIIRYGSEKGEKWINATIVAYNEQDNTYDLRVANSAKYKVNPEAEHVDVKYIRPKEVEKSDIFGAKVFDVISASRLQQPILHSVDEEGCYLTWQETNGGILFLNWSRKKVDGALAFFKTKKKIAGFKFNNNSGKSECLTKVGGPNTKRWYEGWVSFLKLAISFEGDVVLLPFETWPQNQMKNPVTPVQLIYMSGNLITIIEEGEFSEGLAKAEGICAVHGENNDFQVSKMSFHQFLESGTKAGASIQVAKPVKKRRKTTTKRKSKKMQKLMSGLGAT